MFGWIFILAGFLTNVQQPGQFHGLVATVQVRDQQATFRGVVIIDQSGRVFVEHLPRRHADWLLNAFQDAASSRGNGANRLSWDSRPELWSGKRVRVGAIDLPLAIRRARMELPAFHVEVLEYRLLGFAGELARR